MDGEALRLGVAGGRRGMSLPFIILLGYVFYEGNVELLKKYNNNSFCTVHAHTQTPANEY